ncbi:hypothetical protein DACRYDRAFT_14773 [Dacryopinax primogenitus]|uniref:Fungal lipase-like domain-containing protein n=1 Tax=Dacryopinax primogenitus (strain DJM 731) TaxID=1858805 RepID=M5G6C0_DACPD|nr:uncharacterized protein DACRYDRAFT_14773 [Dacryopinax primogenitus]EJU03750.1 hypothetical protein DACRYDRAFT_14773 [Dacryopinax primogenitus]
MFRPAASIAGLITPSPYTQFARAAYCHGTNTWSCEEACAANSDFRVYVTGGDDSDTPDFFVGYWPTGNAAIVAHEGTDPLQLLSLNSAIQAHTGFLGAHSRSAGVVLSAVQKVISEHNVTEVITVGHSLGMLHTIAGC